MVRSNVYHRAMLRLCTRKFCSESGLKLEKLLVRNIKRRRVSAMKIEAIMRRREEEKSASRERGEMYETKIVERSSDKHTVEIGWEAGYSTSEAVAIRVNYLR